MFLFPFYFLIQAKPGKKKSKKKVAKGAAKIQYIKYGSELEALLSKHSIPFQPADIATAKKASKKLAMLPDDLQFMYTLDADYFPIKESFQNKGGPQKKRRVGVTSNPAVDFEKMNLDEKE